MAATIDLVSGPWDDDAGLPEDAYSAMVTAWFGPGGAHDDPSGNALRVVGDSSGMQVKVRPGDLTWLGQWGRLDDETPIDINSNPSGSVRKDLVVVRRDASANTLTVYVVMGTPGSPAPAPSAQEAPLAVVTVEAGAGTVGNPVQSIASGKVTEARQSFPVGITRCTADTKPATPYMHQMIGVDGHYEFWNGTKWVRLVESDDTGWVEVAYATGWGPYAGGGAYPPKVQVRRIGSLVMLRGLLVRTTTAGVVTSMLTIPAGFRPPYTHRYATRAYAYDFDVYIVPTGELRVAYAVPAVPVGGAVVLDSSWFVD